jgi:tetratricopeptide (TPR) repeat protein
MYFHSSEEYNNYISGHPANSHVVWEYPSAPEAHYQRALAFGRSGRLKSSHAEIERSLAGFPNSAKYLVESGFILREMRLAAEARARFEGAIRNDLTSGRVYEARAHLGLGLLAVENGDFAAARREFLHVWRLVGNDRELIAHLQLVAELERDPRQQAEFFVSRCDWLTAEAAFRDALTLNPDDFEMRLGIAYCYKEMQALERAEEHLKYAFRLNPHSSEVNFALGWVYTLASDFERAESEFHRVIEKNRYDIGCFIGLALLYLEQIKDGATELSAKFFSAINRAEELDQSVPDMHMIIADYYFHTGDHTQALKAIHRAIRLSPNSQEPHVLAAEIYVEMGRKRRSLFHLDEASDFGRDTDRMRSLRSRLQDESF